MANSMSVPGDTAAAGTEPTNGRGRIAQMLRRIPPFAWDGALALLLLGVGLIQLGLPPGPDPRGFVESGLPATATLMVITIPLALRRRLPWPVFVVVSAGSLLGSPLFDARETSSEAVAHAVALYTVVERSPLRWAVPAGLVGVAVAWLHTYELPASQDLAALIYNLAFYALVWAGGVAQRERGTLTDQLAERAAELERERERLAAAAVAVERRRIGRELQRLISREVESMEQAAGTALEALRRGDDDAAAIESIEARGRMTLVELRRLLAVLRRAEPESDGGSSSSEERAGDRVRVFPWLGPLAARPLFADAVLAVLLAASVLLEIRTESVPDTSTKAILLTTGAAGLLVLRRLAPLPTLIAVFGAIVVMQHELPFPLPTTVLICFLVAAYTVATRSGAAAAPLALALGVVAYSFNAPEERIALAQMLFTGAVTGFAIVLGRAVRERRHKLDALAERTRILAETRSERARLAVGEERGRVAREMHDLVAHGVSLMVLQAGAARRVLPGEPAQAVDALEDVENAAGQTRDELRRLLSTLEAGTSEDGEELPKTLDLDSLVTGLRAAGHDVELRLEGERRPLGGGLELTLYRVAQEALTNARKHAAGARAHVVVRYEDDAVELAVTDEGPGDASARHSLPGSGHGLLGARERVVIFGGQFHAGTRPHGGFELRARLPVEVA